MFNLYYSLVSPRQIAASSEQDTDVRAITPRSIFQIAAQHPRSSAQDVLLLSGVMTGALLLALEYDLFIFANELTTASRKLTLAEIIFLTVLLVIGIVLFILRRLREERADHARAFALELEMRDLKQQAMQDPLTGLPNRRAMLAALAEATKGPRCNGRRHAFFLMDLNYFKQVNDRYGHAVGDRVLQIVVERFRAAARPADILARLGGDEFAVLACDVDRDAALAIGQRFVAALRSDILVEGHAHRIGVSVGAALIPDDGVTLAEILRNADLAMYRAKEANSPMVMLYEPAPERAASA
jgi:diguanylate cyclase (GGDEF)-like protein